MGAGVTTTVKPAPLVILKLGGENRWRSYSDASGFVVNDSRVKCVPPGYPSCQDGSFPQGFEPSGDQNESSALGIGVDQDVAASR